MNYLMNLKSHIGSEKTLVITGSGFNAERYSIFSDKVFVRNVPEGIRPYEPQQQEMLQYHIDERGCSQIILVGVKNQMLMERMEKNDTLLSIPSALKFNLSVLLGNQSDQFLSDAIRHQMLFELHVISQCRLLLDYFFIKKKVESNELQVKGLVTELKSERLKSIFCNGIAFNDLLTLN